MASLALVMYNVYNPWFLLGFNVFRHLYFALVSKQIHQRCYCGVSKYTSPVHCGVKYILCTFDSFETLLIIKNMMVRFNDIIVVKYDVLYSLVVPSWSLVLKCITYFRYSQDLELRCIRLFRDWQDLAVLQFLLQKNSRWYVTSWWMKQVKCT